MEMNQHQYAYEGIDCGGATIRDSVHGEIFIPQKFLPIIDSYAFQRLHRVKQLATAQYVFPGATHTRFSHSLGTFHIMRHMIAHFERYFQVLGQSDLIKPQDKDLLLVASLLHDLGHTPFSHALEDVMPNAQKIPHERWTTDIITDSTGELFKIIESTFGKGSAKRIAELILMHQDSENDPFFSANDINLFNIFHSLISSQLDADRLDYIRRDSLATGVSYGLLDIDRLVSGFQIGIREDGKAVVCVAEKNLPDVEGYLYARYQMYRNVYLKPYKMLTEELLKKIIQCVYELYDFDKLKISDLPVGFKNALQKPYMSINDFLSLDDHVIMGAVKAWSELTGKHVRILRELCRCLINRTGYRQYTFIDVLPDTLRFFKEELVALLKPYMLISPQNKQRTDDEWVSSFPFLVLRVEYPQLYKTEKDNIYVLENGGRLLEISDCSNLVRAFLPCSKGEGEKSSYPNEGITSAVSAIYYNPEMLKLYLCDSRIFKLPGNDKNEIEKKIENVKKKVEDLFERHQARNSIEIEKKYYVPTGKNWDMVKQDFLKCFENLGYTIKLCKVDNNSTSEESAVLQQCDRYLDTAEDILLTNNCSLRIRIKQGKREITCKRPTKNSRSCGGQGQMERYEYVSELPSIGEPEELYRSTESKTFINKYLGDIVRFENLSETIIVNNNRIRYLIEKSQPAIGEPMTREQYELAFDEVTYTNCRTNKQYSEHQIELELKSDPATRLNMQILTSKIDEDLAHYDLIVMTESKYERAKYFTQDRV